MKNTISGNEARGFMKILVDAKTDTVIGVHMIGPDCAEIMQVQSHVPFCSQQCLISSQTVRIVQCNAMVATVTSLPIVADCAGCSAPCFDS